MGQYSIKTQPARGRTHSPITDHNIEQYKCSDDTSVEESVDNGGESMGESIPRTLTHARVSEVRANGLSVAAGQHRRRLGTCWATCEEICATVPPLADLAKCASQADHKE